MKRRRKWYARNRPEARCPVVLTARGGWTYQCEMTAGWPHEHPTATLQPR